ncbi:DUF4367 domain-containing protein [Anoxybacterium hadale]|uniref:DUF4367 domain-containing protein n=1 Tax=Anoxybacterium hadale TaxID=3408580 RepID=A0ACD1A6Q6_9FIRM|nr:DUF4367 domain-containing protein [Clostridiales bacterium]
MKKVITIVLCAVMAFSFAACESSANGPDRKTGDNTQIPNPFVDCSTIQEAEDLAGFTAILPQRIPDGYSLDSIQAIKNDLIQMIYENGEGEITYRQAKGSDDISGSYVEYPEENTMTLGSLEVTVKGNEGTVSVATWVNGAYTFALMADSDGNGLANTAISDMINSMEANDVE